MKAARVVFALVACLAVSGVVLAQNDATTEAGANTLGKTGGGTLGKTGGGTLTATGGSTLAADSDSPAVELAVSPGSVVGPGTVIVTVKMPADAATASSHSYPVPLASSDAACHVPTAVSVAWSSATGGAASFLVQCSAVSSDRSVTITAGNASVGFDLKH